MNKRGVGVLAFCMSVSLVVPKAATAAAGPPAVTNVAMVRGFPQLTISGQTGTTNQILSVTNLAQVPWVVLSNIVVAQSSYVFTDSISAPGSQRFYQVIDPNLSSAPPNMALIPPGTFEMGDDFSEGAYYELPLHQVYVSAFYMDKYEVTTALWNNVVTWASQHGYSFDNPGSGKATNHPIQSVSWYDVVKWCNARSQMEGRAPSYYTDSALTQLYTNGQIAPYVNWNAGYRLPTEAEWEKADRGGASGHRFPWANSDTISHSQANYYADTNLYQYDISPSQGYNPAFVDGVLPYTSPVGSFAPNGYGLYDTAGNVWEWCWDFAGSYPSTLQTDPRGPDTGSTRIGRGGNWNYYAIDCRDSYRYGNDPNYIASNIGFRCALSSSGAFANSAIAKTR